MTALLQVMRAMHGSNGGIGPSNGGITMPKEMTPQSWQVLRDTLELWKKQAQAADKA